MIKALGKDWIFSELAAFDICVYAGKILKHNSACAKIEVPDFGVPHLAIAETDCFAAGFEQGVRVVLFQLVKVGRALEFYGVAELAFALAKAVKNY